MAWWSLTLWQYLGFQLHDGSMPHALCSFQWTQRILAAVSVSFQWCWRWIKVNVVNLQHEFSTSCYPQWRRINYIQLLGSVHLCVWKSFKKAWEQSHPQWCTKSFKSSWKDHSLSPQPADCSSLHRPFDSIQCLPTVVVVGPGWGFWPSYPHQFWSRRFWTSASPIWISPALPAPSLGNCMKCLKTWWFVPKIAVFLRKLETCMISWHLHVLDNKSVILDVAFPMTSFRCFASKVTAKLVTGTGLWVGEVPATSRSS